MDNATEITHQYRAKHFPLVYLYWLDTPYLHNQDGCFNPGPLRSQPIDSILSSSQPQLPALDFDLKYFIVGAFPPLIHPLLAAK